MSTLRFVIRRSTIRTCLSAISRWAIVCVAGLPLGCGSSDEVQSEVADAAPSECVDGDWTCQPVENWSVQRFGGHLSLAAAADDTLAMVFYDAGAKALVVGRTEFGQAPVQVRVSGGDGVMDPGRHNTCAMGPDGDLHVVFREANSATFNYVRLRGLEVVDSQMIDNVGSPGIAPALAVGDDGVAYASYFDSDAGQLRLAVRSLTGAWEVEVVPHSSCSGESCPPAPIYGRYSDVAVSPSGLLVAFYDATFGNLMLGRRSEGKWSVQLLDGADTELTAGPSDVGRWPSMRVSDSGNLSIAYMDATDGALRFMGSPNGQTTLEIVDNGRRVDPESGAEWNTVVGAWTTLSADDSGSPVIYYFDSTNFSVLRSVRRQDGWGEPEPVDTGEAAGRWLAGARLSDGRNAIAMERWDTDGTGLITRRLTWWIEE